MPSGCLWAGLLLLVVGLDVYLAVDDCAFSDGNGRAKNTAVAGLILGLAGMCLFLLFLRGIAGG